MGHYIDKDKVVEHLYKMLEKHPKNYYILCILDFIDTLEWKEVDLEKELKDYCSNYYNCDYPKQLEEGTCSEVMPHIVSAAKHFFELRLKAQKGE